MAEVAVVIGLGDMGAAIARRIGPGRTLVLADRNPELLAARSKEFSDAGFDVRLVEVDVCDGRSVRALAERASEMGSIRSVAHTAGVSPVDSSVEAILAVDLIGTAWVLEEFGKVIADGGAAVVIASMAAALLPPLDPELDAALARTPAAELDTVLQAERARFSDPGLSYALAKQVNLSQVAATSLSWAARGARVNAISPGVISTAMGRAELAGASGEIMRMMVDGSATKRLGTPEDIAPAAEFLLGPQSSFITGTSLLVDGGVVAGIRHPA